MGCATISGIGSRIFCRAAKAMWEGLRRTTDCSSKRFSSDFELVSLGAISLSALAIGRSSTSASVGGRRDTARASVKTDRNDARGIAQLMRLVDSNGKIIREGERRFRAYFQAAGE